MAVKKKIDDILFRHRAKLLEDRKKCCEHSYYNMEDDPEISSYVTALSVKYQVLCEKTAYLMVIQKNQNDGKKAVKVNIPNPESDDYKEDFMAKGAP